jgi:CheY-like chemotaxis protein
MADRDTINSGREDVGTSRTYILIVEDDAVDIGEFLQIALELGTSYLLLVATTAQRALEMVQAIKPHLLLVDYHLKNGLDGHEGIDLYDRLHALPELEAIPAIIMTAAIERHRADIEQRHLLSLAKPFGVEKLIACVEQVLHSHQLQYEIPSKLEA